MSSATIEKREIQKGISKANTRIVNAVKSFLELSGMEFNSDRSVNPGLTMRSKRGEQTLAALSLSLFFLVPTAVFM